MPLRRALSCLTSAQLFVPGVQASGRETNRTTAKGPDHRPRPLHCGPGSGERREDRDGGAEPRGSIRERRHNNLLNTFSSKQREGLRLYDFDRGAGARVIQPVTVAMAEGMTALQAITALTARRTVVVVPVVIP